MSAVPGQCLNYLAIAVKATVYSVPQFQIRYPKENTRRQRPLVTLLLYRQPDAV
jgi:hypothetical protein